MSSSSNKLILRCTKDFRTRLKLSVTDSDADNHAATLGSWYVKQLPEGYRTWAMALNEVTRLAVVVEMPRGKGIDRFAERFRNQLGRILLDEGLPGSVIAKVMNEYSGEVVVSTTRDRSIMGTLNNMADMACYWLAEPRYREDFKLLHDQVNDTPQSSMGFQNACEKLREVLGQPKISHHRWA
jgi:hypothetical protein